MPMRKEKPKGAPRYAARKATRVRQDEYLVETDLDDADQLFPLPNMKEKD